MLDNVLDATGPRSIAGGSPGQGRVGLGFTGLGDAPLVRLRLRFFNTDDGRQMAARITEFMRATQAYLASVELAKERGASLFNADLYLSGGTLRSRLPTEVKERSAHGLRNSHLLSIAPPAPSAWPSPTTPATASSPPRSVELQPQEAPCRWRTIATTK